MRDTAIFFERIIERLEKLPLEEIKRVFSRLKSEFGLGLLILDNLTEGVIALDKHNAISAYNKQAAILANLSSNARGKNVLDAVGFAPLRAEIEKSIATTENTERVLFDDGPPLKALSVKTLPLGKQGILHGLLVLIEDITESWQKEQQLKRAEQLASLTTLAAGLAHEIKNPLGALDIYAQLTEKIAARLTPETPEIKEIRNNLSIVREEISRLEDIVNGFLFAVKKLDLAIAKYDFMKLIADTLNLLKPEIEQSCVNVEVSYTGETLEVDIDERLIKQALINIVQNALDAVKHASEKRIDITITANEQTNTLRVKIADTGKGIPNDDLAKIFEPYYTTKQFGTGLGLTNVYRIMEAHKGVVRVLSEEGKGTEVTLELPMRITERKLIERND